MPVPAFYVALNGNDNNAGTLASPIATIAKAQSAMQGSSTVKTTYIRAGSYTPPTIANCDGSETCGIMLSSADNGETFSYYPPDGVDSADLTGGSAASGNGLWEVFNVANSSHVTINGLSIHNFQFAAIAWWCPGPSGK